MSGYGGFYGFSIPSFSDSSFNPVVNNLFSGYGYNSAPAPQNSIEGDGFSGFSMPSSYDFSGAFNPLFNSLQGPSSIYQNSAPASFYQTFNLPGFSNNPSATYAGELPSVAAAMGFGQPQMGGKSIGGGAPFGGQPIGGGSQNFSGLNPGLPIQPPGTQSVNQPAPVPAQWQQYQSALGQLSYDQLYPQIMAQYGNMLNLAGTGAASLQQQNNQLTGQQTGQMTDQLLAEGLGNSTVLPSMVGNLQSQGSIRGANIAANAANQKLGVYGQQAQMMSQLPAPIAPGAYGTASTGTPIEQMGATLFGGNANVDNTQLPGYLANNKNQTQQTMNSLNSLHPG